MLAKIAEMPEPDRVIAERVHAIVTATAPALAPRTWYGMPAYAKDGTVVCFFQSAQKFKSRYATLGFNAKANLDDGAMWPTGLRAEGADRRRRGPDRRPREAGGELSAELAAEHGGLPDHPTADARSARERLAQCRSAETGGQL